MIIPSKRQKLLRNFQEALFYKEDNYSYQDRSYSFYLLVRPMLEFLKDRLEGSLEPKEIESELYLMCIDLFNSYDKDRSSIVPYLEKAIPWHIRILFEKVEKLSNNIIDISGELEESTLSDDFCWKNILLEDRFVGKCFTRGEKYLIYTIIESDKKELSANAIAKKLNLKRWQVKKRLRELKEVFELEEIDVRTK